MDKRCFLPTLHPLKKNHLWFVEYTPDTQLIPNRFGILEPSRAGKTLIPAWSLDLVLLPIVAFDNTANRLGMGLGYYDATFVNLKNHPLYDNLPQEATAFSPPVLLGLAYEFQCVKKVPIESFDVPLAGVVTEERVLFAEHNMRHRLNIPTFKEL